MQDVILYLLTISSNLSSSWGRCKSKLGPNAIGLESLSPLVPVSSDAYSDLLFDLAGN